MLQPFEYGKIPSASTGILNVAEVSNSQSHFNSRHRPSPTNSLNVSGEFKKGAGVGQTPSNPYLNQRPQQPHAHGAQFSGGSTQAIRGSSAAPPSTTLPHPPGHRYNRGNA